MQTFYRQLAFVREPGKKREYKKEEKKRKEKKEKRRYLSKNLRLFWFANWIYTNFEFNGSAGKQKGSLDTD